MTEQEFQQLLRKYEEGTATPEEVRQVEVFFQSYLKEAEREQFAITGDAQARKEKLLASIYANVPAQKRRSLVFYRIAATILLLIAAAVGVYFYYISTQTVSTQQTIVSDLAPGGDKAILQLADNSTINLDSTTATAVPQQGSSIVTLLKGQLSYTAQAVGSELIYNKIITPRGGQYQVTLADGTKVWLNASSSLRYPVAFASNQRIVELTGEAYFEVAKDAKKPFKVILDNMQVEVLGTHFNVMAYADEGAIKTTLVEGAVAVSLSSGEGRGEVSGVRLTPGQQAQLANSTLKIVNNADLDEALAWKNGRFSFESASIEAIMRQLSRWYNVDFEFEGNARDLNFFFEVSRKSNVSAALRLMERTKKVHFEIYADKIVVKPGIKPESKN